MPSIVTKPAVDDGLYTAVHEPADRVQEGGVNVPPALPSLNVTVPVGVDAVPVDVSDTVTLYVIGFPATIVDGLGVMVVLVLRAVSCNDDAPKLISCIPSPLYDVVIVKDPVVEGGLYTAVHEPADRVQEGGVNVPPSPPSLNVTVPVGLDAVPESTSSTVTAYVMLFPRVITEGLSVIVVLVLRAVTCNEDMPELPECVPSPP
jgi:hypothetical protein